MLASYRMEQRLSTAYHPQTDNATERGNKETETYLQAQVFYAQHDWADYLLAAHLAINNRDVASLVGIGPFFAAHGYHPSNIQKVQLASVLLLWIGKERANLFIDKLNEITTFMLAAMTTTQQRFKNQAGKQRQLAPRYEVSDVFGLYFEISSQTSNRQKSLVGNMPNVKL